MRGALLVFVLASGACARLRKVAGLSDLEAIARQAEAAADVYHAAASKLPSPRESREAVAMQNVQTLGALHKALVSEREAATQASLGSAHCPKCVRTYRERCPQAWAEDAQGACEAAVEYAGPCKSHACLSELTYAGKRSFEERCNVCWACAEQQPLVTRPQDGPMAALRG